MVMIIIDDLLCHCLSPQSISSCQSSRHHWQEAINKEICEEIKVVSDFL